MLDTSMGLGASSVVLLEHLQESRFYGRRWAVQGPAFDLQDARAWRRAATRWWWASDWGLGLVVCGDLGVDRAAAGIGGILGHGDLFFHLLQALQDGFVIGSLCLGHSLHLDLDSIAPRGEGGGGLANGIGELLAQGAADSHDDGTLQRLAKCVAHERPLQSMLLHLDGRQGWLQLRFASRPFPGGCSTKHVGVGLAIARVLHGTH